MAWAVCLLGAAEAQRKRGGYYDPIHLDAVAQDQVTGEARFVLGEQAFLHARTAGQQLTPQQALAARERFNGAEVAEQNLPEINVGQLDWSMQVETEGSDKDLPLVEHLTKREMDVLRLLAEGQSNAEIAQHLVLSIVTVNSYLRSIYGKLGVSSRTRAVRCAIEQKLLP